MKSIMGKTGENAGPDALRERVRSGWQGQGVTAPARAGRAVRRRWLPGLITACALTLGVVDGHNSGIGGGCFMTLRLADGRVITLGKNSSVH